MVVRQSPRLPTRVPSGAPSAVAPLDPAITTAIARPRRSAGTRAAAVAVAVGVNSAPPSPASARDTSTNP